MIAIANDHGGYNLAVTIIAGLKNEGVEVIHLGSFSAESVDYPDYARALSVGVASGKFEKGILVCGTGVGMSIAANKVAGIRAALCGEQFTAEMTRRHNDANVLCLGARVTGDAHAFRIVKTFLETEFEGGRHCARISKIAEIEENRT